MRYLAILLVLLMAATASAQAVICYDLSTQDFQVTIDGIPPCEGAVTVFVDVGSTGDPNNLIEITSIFSDLTPPSLCGSGIFGGGPDFCGVSVTVWIVCTPPSGPPIVCSETTTINCDW